MLSFIKKVPSLLKATANEWNNDNAMRLAAALAYYTVFSLVPLVLAAIAISGLIFGREAATGKVFAELQSTVGPDVAAAVQEIIDAQKEPAKSYAGAILGFLMGLVGASGVFGELKNSLNEIWEVEEEKGNGIWLWIRGRFLSVGMVMGVCFLMLSSLMLNSFLAVAAKTGFSWVPPGVAIIGQTISFLLSFGFVTVLFAAMFKFLPRTPLLWRDVWVGAGVTAFLFTLGKFGLEQYLARAEVASGYGAAGALALLLVWVYYSAQIFFFGAEFTKVYTTRHGSRIAAPATGNQPAAAGVPKDENDGLQYDLPVSMKPLSLWGLAALVVVAAVQDRKAGQGQ